MCRSTSAWLALLALAGTLGCGGDSSPGGGAGTGMDSPALIFNGLSHDPAGGTLTALLGLRNYDDPAVSAFFTAVRSMLDAHPQSFAARVTSAKLSVDAARSRKVAAFSDAFSGPLQVALTGNGKSPVTVGSLAAAPGATMGMVALANVGADALRPLQEDLRMAIVQVQVSGPTPWTSADQGEVDLGAELVLRVSW